MNKYIHKEKKLGCYNVPCMEYYVGSQTIA